jgi:hypothetical protein
MPRKFQFDPRRVKRPYSKEQTRGLRRGTGKSALPLPRTSTTAVEPTLTPTAAQQFVKLTLAGVPGVIALRYFGEAYYDSCDAAMLHAWLKRWTSAKLTRKAHDAFNSGAWETLDKDKRLTLALDKHYAELAYWLYSHSYELVSDDSLRKTTDARTALMAKLQADKIGDPDSPWAKFTADLLAGKVTIEQPPRLAGEPSILALPTTVRTAES